MTKETKAVQAATVAPVAQAVEAAPAVVSTNFKDIKWPQDPAGCLLDLKRGGIASARRIKGNPDKLESYLASLRLLAAHAKAICDKDANARTVSKENAVAASRRVREKYAEDAERRATEHEAAAARVRRVAGIAK